DEQEDGGPQADHADGDVDPEARVEVRAPQAALDQRRRDRGAHGTGQRDRVRGQWTRVTLSRRGARGLAGEPVPQAGGERDRELDVLEKQIAPGDELPRRAADVPEIRVARGIALLDRRAGIPGRLALPPRPGERDGRAGEHEELLPAPDVRVPQVPAG